MSKELKALYNKYAREYDSVYNKDVCQEENSILASIFEDHNRKHPFGNVADLGSGTGLFLDLFYMEPKFYDGFDFSKSMIKYANEKYPDHQFYYRDLSGRPLLTLAKQYNTVTALFSISEIGLDNIVLWASALLDNGGHFIGLIPTRYHYPLIYAHANKKIVHRSYTKKQLTKHLSLGGFHLEMLVPISWCGLNIKGVDISSLYKKTLSHENIKNKPKAKYYFFIAIRN